MNAVKIEEVVLRLAVTTVEPERFPFALQCHTIANRYSPHRDNHLLRWEVLRLLNRHDRMKRFMGLTVGIYVLYLIKSAVGINILASYSMPWWVKLPIAPIMAARNSDY